MWLLILLNDEADKKRFESLLKLYGDMMYRIAFGILKNREDAEDAVQQVMLGILCQKNKALFDDIESKDVYYYLKKSIKNESVRIIKRRLPTQESDDEPYYDEDITGKIALNELYHKVIEQIKRMDKIYREPLYMRCVLGYSVKKIAKLTKSKPDTVEKRIARGKQIIRETVGIENYDF